MWQTQWQTTGAGRAGTAHEACCAQAELSPTGVRWQGTALSWHISPLTGPSSLSQVLGAKAQPGSDTLALGSAASHSWEPSTEGSLDSLLALGRAVTAEAEQQAAVVEPEQTPCFHWLVLVSCF